MALADPWLTCSCVGNYLADWPARFTGVTDVITPAIRSWPEYDSAQVVTRPIVRHGVTMRHGASRVSGLLGFHFNHIVLSIEVTTENHLSRLD